MFTRVVELTTKPGKNKQLSDTGRRLSLPFCEICHFDERDEKCRAAATTINNTLLTQLGHVTPLAAGKAAG